MMIKDCKLLIELQDIHTDTRTSKACKTNLLKYKKWLIMVILIIKIKWNII